MAARRVILAERRAANDNFADSDLEWHEHDCGPGGSHRHAIRARLGAMRTLLRVLLIASFSLVVLILISAMFVLVLALVGVFAAGLAVVRLIGRHIPALSFQVHRVDRSATG
jgi:hypothetical protein